VTAAITSAVWWDLRPLAPPLAVTRFAVALGEGQQFSVLNNPMLAVSPDGTWFVYVANNQLYLRSMSDLEARPIPGTQQADTPFAPVFSPDSRSIAFYSQSERAIKKIAVSGGAAVTICPADVESLGRMNWDADGIVFVQARKGLMRVSANGGQPEVLVSVKDGEVAYGPQLLPGGEWVLFTVATATTADAWDKAQVVVQSLKSSERRTLVSGGSDGRYVPTGHLVYALGGVLFAVPFDLGHLAIRGGPAPIIEGVRRANTGLTGVAHFSVSSTGSLVFIPGPVSLSSALSDLALVDRNGTLQPLKLQPGAYEYPRLSPDGTRIAFDSDDRKDATVWIYDVSGTSAMRRLTVGARNRMPIWSADGEHVAFQSDRDGDLGIFWQRTTSRATARDSSASSLPDRAPHPARRPLRTFRSFLIGRKS
jgi:Tol biopolymer transport system component